MEKLSAITKISSQNKLMNDGKDNRRHSQRCGAGYFWNVSEWNPRQLWLALGSIVFFRHYRYSLASKALKIKNEKIPVMNPHYCDVL